MKWKFANVPQLVDVVVHEAPKNQRILFEWQADGGVRTRVVMVFQPLGNQETMIQISESAWRDPEGIKASYGNAGGWMHMMCCMRGHLEYGINLGGRRLASDPAYAPRARLPATLKCNSQEPCFKRWVTAYNVRQD